MPTFVPTRTHTLKTTYQDEKAKHQHKYPLQMSAKYAILKGGNGGWDVTTYPWGGDFTRLPADTFAEVVDKPSHVGEVGDVIFVRITRPNLRPAERVAGFKRSAVLSIDAE